MRKLLHTGHLWEIRRNESLADGEGAERLPRHAEEVVGVVASLQRVGNLEAPAARSGVCPAGPCNVSSRQCSTRKACALPPAGLLGPGLMRAFEGAGVPRASGRTLLFGLRFPPARAQRDTQLRPAADAELPVDACEIRFEGLDGQERRRGNLTVRTPHGRQISRRALRPRSGRWRGTADRYVEAAGIEIARPAIAHTRIPCGTWQSALALHGCQAASRARWRS